MKPNSNLLALVQDALGKESRLGNIYVMVNDGAVIMAGSVTHSAYQYKLKHIR